MNPEMKPDVTAQELQVEVDTTEAGSLSPVTQTADYSSNAYDSQFQQAMDKASAFLADLPAYLTNFFGEYKRPLTVIGLAIGAIITIKLTLAVLDAVNDIPLLSPLFELIGLSYSAWFVYRYLLRASNRQELSNDFNRLKEQVLGKRYFES